MTNGGLINELTDWQGWEMQQSVMNTQLIGHIEFTSGQPRNIHQHNYCALIVSIHIPIHKLTDQCRPQADVAYSFPHQYKPIVTILLTQLC